MNRKLYSINNSLIDSFKRSLEDKGFTEVTIKNYVTDINQFITWRKLNNFNSSDSADAFARDMSRKFSRSSIKRKTSSIAKFLEFEDRLNSSNNSEFADKFSFRFAPVLIGAVAILSFPALLQSFSGPNAPVDSESSATIPDNVVISVSSKNSAAYEVRKTKGINVILTDDSLPPKPLEYYGSNTLSAASHSQLPPTSSQGLATIHIGETETLIVNDNISEESFILLTPKSPTGNRTLYIKEVKDGFAKISIEEAFTQDIIFQWKSDNTEVYHSIL